MSDCIAKLDGFLRFNERNVLTHAGKVSRELAMAHAEGQFERYQDEGRKLEAATPSSDFDHVMEQAKQLEAKRGQNQLGKGKRGKQR